MEAIEQRVPMRWPSGPLEIAWREKQKTLTPAAAEVIRRWQDPSTLAVLEGGPVNCLVVRWASGIAADAEQQKTLKPLVEGGRKAGIAFAGLIDGAADRKAAIASARAAGLAAVLVAGGGPSVSDFPVIPFTTGDLVPWDSAPMVLGITDGLWPGVAMSQGGGVSAGPTGMPWVDSNGAFLRIAEALGPKKAVWLAFDHPKEPKVLLNAESYVLSIADAAAYGGRWVISLDDELRAGLASRNTAAMGTWKAIAGALGFFERHAALQAYEPAGALAVICDFVGPNRVLGEETLNLLPRRRVAFRVIATRNALNTSFAGLKAIFFADQQLPVPALRQKLLTFAQSGGTLFVLSTWRDSKGLPVEAEPHLIFRLLGLGKGRLAVAKEATLDPYEVASDIQEVMSHREDLLRVFNAMASNCHYKSAPDGKQAIVNILNYNRRPGALSSLYLKRRYRSARFLSPGTDSALNLKTTPLDIGGMEVVLPPLPVFGIVQLEG